MFIMNVLPVLLLSLITNAIGLPDDIAYNRSRLERATDEEFSTSIKRMEMISRVTNGISLRQGLSKGSITNEELISELLNLGGVRPSDIEQIDTEEFKELIEGMRNLSDTIYKQPSGVTLGAVMQIRERLEKLNSFIQIGNSEEAMEEPGEEFVDAVTRIKDSQLEWKELKLFAERLSDLYTSAENVADRRYTEESKFVKLAEKLKEGIEGVMQQNDLSSFEEELAGDSICEASKKLEVFPILKEFEKIDGGLSYDSDTDDTVINFMENSLNGLTTVTEKMWNELETIQILEKLFVLRRHKSGNHDSKLIPAFSSDTSEFGLLFNDLKDSWLQTEVKGQASILKKAFQPFSVLKEKTEKVEESINTTSDASLTGINLVLSQIEYLSQFSHTTDLPPGTLKNVLKSSAEAKELLPKISDKLENLHKNMIQLCNYITNVKALLRIWEEVDRKNRLGKLSDLHTQASLVDNIKAAEQLETIEIDEDFQEILNIVQGSKEYTETVKKDFELKKIVESVVSDYKEMVTFVQKVNQFSGAIVSMKQFRKLKNPESVFMDIGSIEYEGYDKFRQEVDIDSVIEAIGNTKSALKELDETINSMKQAKGNEIDGLVGMTDATESARNIGSATKAISNMNKFLDLDTSKLDDSVKEVQRIISRQTSIEHKNTVKALVALVDQIQNFKQEIESFKDSVQPITSSKLSDYSEIFEKAKSVKGIGRDFLKLSVSVGELPGYRKIIDEIKELLVNMDKLCLRYSKYQTAFDESKNTLNNIDMLFTSLQVSMTATTPATPAPILHTTVKEIQPCQVSFTTCPKKIDEMCIGAKIAIIMGVSIIFMMSVAVGLATYYNCKGKKKRDRK